MAFHITPPNLLPKTDEKHRKWLESLKKRPLPWNKGYTKKDNLSVAKISQTFKKKEIDNFKNWRLEQISLGKFSSPSQKLERTKELAELIGVILGDGNIYKFPRTEALTIASNAKNSGFINRYAELVYKIFSKKPTINKIADGCIKIRIY